MEFELTSEQQMMVDSAKRMVETLIQPILDRNDRNKPLPKAATHELIQAGAALGITGARIPEGGGGTALRALDYGLIHEQLPASAALILQPHEATTMRLYYGCSQEQRDRYLADFMSGAKITCSAITEPDTGSNPNGVRTRLDEEGDSFILNGRKMWISNAPVCDVMNVTCRRVVDGKEEVVRVLVDREESEFEARNIDVIGLKQAHLGEVVFDNCRVPKKNLCVGEANSAKVHTLAWLTNRPLVGLTAVGLAQKALDAAVEYAKTRKQFGKYIGGFQIIQQDLADIQTAVVASRLVCYNALAAVDRGERANGLSAMAKRFAVDTCDKAIAIAMRIHGAMGLSAELGLEQLARDARTLTIPDGTPGILGLIQGRELTGLDAFR
ncbi:MAG: acyl-CoA dehydrogenase family protein [Variibacter sp.]